MTKYGTKEKGLLKNYRQDDERYTPTYAIEPLLQYIDKKYTIYEPCGINDETGLQSNIPAVFKHVGYKTSESSIHNGIDFLDLNPTEISQIVGYKTNKFAIVTNPPFSKKSKFLAKCYEVGVPFALLLPTTSLEGDHRNKHNTMFRTHGIQVIIPNQRVDFTGHGNVWFHVSWFTWGFNLPKDLIFVKLNKPIRKKVRKK